MDILNQQQDDINLSLWHFKIGGVAFDGMYRVADLSRETTTPANWLAANQTEAQSLIDAGIINEEVNQKRDLNDLSQQLNNEIEWLDTLITNFDALTNAQKLAAIERLARENRATLRAMKYIIRRLL